MYRPAKKPLAVLKKPSVMDKSDPNPIDALPPPVVVFSSELDPIAVL